MEIEYGAGVFDDEETDKHSQQEEQAEGKVMLLVGQQSSDGIQKTPAVNPPKQGQGIQECLHSVEFSKEKIEYSVYRFMDFVHML